MSASLPFSAFVIVPKCPGPLDVPGLAFIRPATKQDRKPVAVPAKARAEGDAPFGHALPCRLHIARITRLDPRKRGSHLHGRGRVELVKAIIERRFSLFDDIDNGLNHRR